MNIHEYQAAELLAEYGIPVNAGTVVIDPAGAERVFERIAGQSGRAVLKAQVHSGGRGKAGGIKVVASSDEARSAAERILGMDIRGHVVGKLLVAPAVEIDREYYLGIILDREQRGIT